MKKGFWLLLLILFFTCSTALGDVVYYSTFEGRVSLTGSEPLIKVLIHVGDQVYTLSGPLSGQLGNLSRFRVLVTGAVSKSIYPNTKGDMVVHDYTLINPFFSEEKNWVLGYLRRSLDQLVIIGRDQVIYTITNPQVLEHFTYVDGKALLMGQIEYGRSYTASLTIESFKILQGPDD